MAEQQQQQAGSAAGAIVPLVVEDTEGGDRGGAAGGAAAAAAAVASGGREYRKGNWTLPETMILINAKKMDDERRMRGSDKEKGKSAEFRWKWVENYCWKNGCQRSQNQCNDKWDNLLRDYKKVREYENKLEPGQKSYWACEKHERKERGLPSNMIIQVYDALHEVVDKRPRPLLAAAAGAAGAGAAQASQSQPQIQQQFQQIQQQQHQAGPSMFGMSSGSQPHQQQQQQQMHHQHHHLPVPQAQATEVSKSTESEGSGTQRSPKRRRVSRSGTGAADQGLGPTLTTSAQEISQTLLACEEKKDKRHRDILSFEERKLGVEERKLMLEETKTEISRQGMEGLIAAVNNLANAILTLASERHQAPS